MISTVSFRKRGPREWKWIGDARKITVADVFRQFVFAGNSDDHLTLEVDKIIEQRPEPGPGRLFRHPGGQPAGKTGSRHRKNLIFPVAKDAPANRGQTGSPDVGAARTVLFSVFFDG